MYQGLSRADLRAQVDALHDMMIGIELCDNCKLNDQAAPDGQRKKCIDGEVNCGILHDTMSCE